MKNLGNTILSKREGFLVRRWWTLELISWMPLSNIVIEEGHVLF